MQTINLTPLPVLHNWSILSGFRERLRDGDRIIIAEGYMAEFEKRCYLANDSFAPVVVLDHPHLVTGLHEEFVHAGTDVIEAFTVSYQSVVLKGSFTCYHANLTNF